MQEVIRTFNIRQGIIDVTHSRSCSTFYARISVYEYHSAIRSFPAMYMFCIHVFNTYYNQAVYSGG